MEKMSSRKDKFNEYTLLASDILNKNWNFCPYVWADGVFTKAETEKIIRGFDDYIPGDAGVGKSTDKPRDEDDYETDSSIRSSEVGWIDYSKNKYNWIYDRIAMKMEEINDAFYGFDLVEPYLFQYFQVAKYNVNDHYTWHTDSTGGDQSIRRLSFTVLLNDPKEYEGGELQIFNGETNPKMNQEIKQGSIIIFPSFEWHRVTPVTKGTRISLVGWCLGNAMK